MSATGGTGTLKPQPMPLPVTKEQVAQAFDRMWNSTTDEEFLRRYHSEYRPLADSYNHQLVINRILQQ